MGGNRSSLLALFCLVLAMWVGGGCAGKSLPSVPKPPQARMQTLEEAIRMQLPTASVIPDKLPDAWNIKVDKSAGSTKLAVIGQVEVSGGDGREQLASSLLTAMMRREKDGYMRVADRTTLERQIRELELTDQTGGEDVQPVEPSGSAGNKVTVNVNAQSPARKWAKLTDAEKAQRLGRLVMLDYMLFAAVTEYSSTVTQITLHEQYLPGERERYEKEYNEFIAACDQQEMEIRNANPIVKRLPGSGDSELSILRIQQRRSQAKSPDEMDRQLRNTPMTETLVQVGVAAKLIDPITGTPVWSYSNNARDTDRRRGLERLVEDMMTHMLREAKKEPTLSTAIK